LLCTHDDKGAIDQPRTNTFHHPAKQFSSKDDDDP
jgi:hypothetical protein